MCCLATVAGCGEAEDDIGDRVSISVVQGTAYIRCRGGDCLVGVVRDGGLLNLGARSTRDGTTEERYLELLSVQNVDIETGTGTDTVVLMDAFIPGTVRIATGAGDDLVDICDSGASLATRITTGDGHDRVSLDPGNVGHLFRLDLGDGDDQLYVGSLYYVGDVRLDGGLGEDTVLRLDSPLDLVGFEHRPDD